MNPTPSPAPVPPAVAGTTVAQAKELWSEVLFYLALFFGLLHFAGLFLQGLGMLLHTAFQIELSLKITSSMLMGNVYLAFLAAYVGGKEFLRPSLPGRVDRGPQLTSMRQGFGGGSRPT